MSGSRRFATSCKSGSRWDGLKRRVRSAPALDLLLIGAKESERPFAIASNFRHEATRQFELNPFEAAWRSRDCTCRSTAAWYAEFRSELLGFPAGKHDDQVDALGLVGQLLDQMVSGKSRESRKSPKLIAVTVPWGSTEQAARLDAILRLSTVSRLPLALRLSLPLLASSKRFWKGRQRPRCSSQLATVSGVCSRLCGN